MQCKQSMEMGGGEKTLASYQKYVHFMFHCGGKQPFSENRVQIGASVRLKFRSQEVPDTHRQTAVKI